jgi:exodeoxyribonuclease VII large subunit
LAFQPELTRSRIKRYHRNLGQTGFDFAPRRRVFSVSELNGAIAGLLAEEFDDIWVSGEISGCRVLGSGHCYFTMKERDSQIRCALFKGTARFLKFQPKDGIAILARGRVDVFAVRGEYQLIVEQIEPQGHGALQLAFEQLKKKLDAEGLFARERKRPMPVYPSRIGIVTSPRGAVISDMLHVMERRFPGLHIRIFPALVQGEGAVEEVVRAIEFFSRGAWADVVIVARGGGSLEDLWTFNDERVARAIAACAIPVISAIGHETDFTSADFVADLRAPTPSAAAELVIATKLELLNRIVERTRGLTQLLRLKLALLEKRVQKQGAERSEAMLHRAINRRFQVLDDKDSRLRGALRRVVVALALKRVTLEERLRYFDVRPKLERDRNRLNSSHAGAWRAIERSIESRRRRWENAMARLEQLSPLRVLDRGYAIVQKKGGGILKDPAAIEPGTALEIRLAGGTLEAQSK